MDVGEVRGFPLQGETGTAGRVRALAATTAGLPTLWAGVAGYLALQACVQLLIVDPSSAGGPLAWSGGAGALVAAAVSWWVRRTPVAGSAVLLLAAGAVLLAALQAMAGLAVADQWWHTGEVMLALVAAAWLLAPVQWWVVAGGLLWGGWLAAAVLSGPAGQVAAAALGMGAASAVGVLIRHVRARELDDLAEAEQLVEAASVHDPVTGLVNRRGLLMMAEPIVEAARRQGDAVHATLIAVENLPDYPPADPAGPSEADRCLVEVADALAASVRATDVTAVWSPAVFAVLGPGPGVEPDRLAARVSEHLAREESPVLSQVGQGRQAHPSAGGPPASGLPGQPGPSGQPGPPGPDVSERSEGSDVPERSDLSDVSPDAGPRLVAVSAVLPPWDPGDAGTLLHVAERDLAVLRALRRVQRVAPPARGT